MVALRWSWTFALLACRPAAPPEPAVEPPAPAADSAPVEPEHPHPFRGYRTVDHRLELPSPIGFADGADSPDPGSEAALEHIRGYLAVAHQDAITLLRIEAHAVGPGAQALSERRALAVAKWLVAHGVACTRLLPVGFGDSKPIADPSTAEGQAQNTRIEAVNAELRGRPIGGMPVDGGGKPAGDPCQ